MNLPSCHLLDPMNGARFVDARWRRVCDLLARGELSAHRWDDCWVRAGLYYARQLSACHTPADRRDLAQRMPEVDAAHALYTHPDRLTRGEVEARLLSGQGVEETAAACGLAADAVGVYVRLFFDVLNKLKSREYIMLFAVGGRIWDGSLTEADADILLKYFAFLKGPLFLEPLLRYFRSGLSVPELPDRATAAELDELLDRLRIRALILATVLPFEKLGRVRKLQRLVKRLEGCVARRHAADAVPGKADARERQHATPADSSAEDATPGATPDSPGRPVRWWASLRAELKAA